MDLGGRRAEFVLMASAQEDLRPASDRASPKPSPLLPPVTSATRPFNRNVSRTIDLVPSLSLAVLIPTSARPPQIWRVDEGEAKERPFFESEIDRTCQEVLAVPHGTLGPVCLNLGSRTAIDPFDRGRGVG